MTPVVQPASTAMLILDYQPALLGFLPDPAPFVATARVAADALLGAGGKIAYVRVAFTADDYERFPEESMMGQRVKKNRPGLDADSPSSAFHPGLAPRESDWILRKTRVGAFSTTALDTALRAAGIDTVLIAGVHTSGAVLTTVREAHDLDYQVVVLSDICADPDGEVHDFLIDHIIPRQGRVAQSADLVASLGAGRAS